MSAKDKDQLVKMLSGSHVETKKMLERIDIETIIYSEGDWRIRDILGHVATWDRECVKSIRAFMEGSEYFIPDHDEDEFNRKDIEKHRKLSDADLITEWEQAREEFKAAVNEIPTEKFDGDFRFPWGDPGSIANLIDEMVEHEVEHTEEIGKAVREL